MNKNNNVSGKNRASLNKMKQNLICSYNLALVNDKNINEAIRNINFFKSALLKEIANEHGVIQSSFKLTKEQQDQYNSLVEKEKQLIKNQGKYLPGNQIKKDIYEENTNSTMHLIYYILGIGFMGYYAVKLMNLRQ